MKYEKELAFAKDLAQEAGRVMNRYFMAEDVNIIVKDDKTLLTIADATINSMVIERVKAAFPDHSIHGEEETFIQDNAPYTWVCDPVDGTQPFAKGLPISTFSIALVDARGKSVLGVVYDPYQARLYEGVRGEGAFLNGKKIHVSETVRLDGAYIDQELWINEKEGIRFDDPKDVFNKAGSKITTMCSAIMTGCLVAEGVYDAMVFGQSKPEDIAALSVIVEEAGGKVTDLLGRDQRYDRKIYGAVVSNGQIHNAVLAVLADINYESKYVTPS